MLGLIRCLLGIFELQCAIDMSTSKGCKHDNEMHNLFYQILFSLCPVQAKISFEAKNCDAFLAYMVNLVPYPLTISFMADVEIHPDIKKNFWDPQNWPKYVLVRYTWYEFYLPYFCMFINVTFWSSLCQL
jgi:hypothetical protein